MLIVEIEDAMADWVHGIAYVKMDREQIPIRGRFRLTRGAVERAPIYGQDGIHGYHETAPEPPRAIGEVWLPEGLSAEKLMGLPAGTVTLELDGRHTSFVAQSACQPPT